MWNKEKNLDYLKIKISYDEYPLKMLLTRSYNNPIIEKGKKFSRKEYFAVLCQNLRNFTIVVNRKNFSQLVKSVEVLFLFFNVIKKMNKKLTIKTV